MRRSETFSAEVGGYWRTERGVLPPSRLRGAATNERSGCLPGSSRSLPYGYHPRACGVLLDTVLLLHTEWGMHLASRNSNLDSALGQGPCTCAAQLASLHIWLCAMLRAAICSDVRLPIKQQPHARHGRFRVRSTTPELEQK